MWTSSVSSSGVFLCPLDTFPQLLPLLSPSLPEPWSHLANASCCPSSSLIQRFCPYPAQMTQPNVHRGLSSHLAHFLLWVGILMTYMRLRFILWGSLLAPATDKSSELSLFADTSDGFALDFPTSPSFVSTLSPESPALSTALQLIHWTGELLPVRFGILALKAYTSCSF